MSVKRKAVLFCFLILAIGLAAHGQIWWIIYYGRSAYIDLEVGKGGVREVEGCFELKQAARDFSPDDEAVFLVAKINIPSWSSKAYYKAVIEWYAPPDGTVLHRTETIPNLASGYTWCVWRSLPIRGTAAAEKLGLWKVRVNVPGLTSQMLAFRVGERSSPPSVTAGCPRPEAGASWRDVVALARRAVVLIGVPTNEFDEAGNRLYSYGSGVIISPDGYVLTAAHVLRGLAGTIRVLVEEQEWYEAVLVKMHPLWDPDAEGWSADVALLKIKGVSGLYCLPLGDSESVALEDEIRILGYPRPGDLGVGMILASGKVLGLRRMQGFTLVEFEASPFDKGHSGGPIINNKGEVIGLAMGVEAYEVVGGVVQHQLGIAINTAKEILPTGIGFRDSIWVKQLVHIL